MAGTWDPAQYDRFKAERRQPFADLLALVEPKRGMRAADLGCGTGETTRELHETLRASETLGIDASDAMLAKAPQSSGLSFRRERIEDFSESAWDLLFSNAALHWVADHSALLPRLARLLAPGGQLAVQMPANDSHLSHRVAAQIASELGIPPRADHVLAPERYAEVLHAAGFENVHVRLQIYAHLLDSREDVIEWVKGALLTEYLGKLAPERHDAFLDAYRERLIPRLENERPFLYTYKRVLFRAQWPGKNLRPS